MAALPPASDMRKFVVMGVSGCGKSSVGRALATRLSVEFIDSDDLHPKANINKMSQGEPLTDADRLPWLTEVGQVMSRVECGCVVACSALKRGYRDLIRQEARGPVCFLHLSGSRDVLMERMKSRPGHFMPPSLLDSQLATLEPPQGDEDFVTVDIDQPFDELVEQLFHRVQETSE